MPQGRPTPLTEAARRLAGARWTDLVRSTDSLPVCPVAVQLCMIRCSLVGTVDTDIPVNHSPYFAPVMQPTLDTGTSAMVVAALAWLGR